MLSKKKRLTKKEFDHVFKNGKRVHTPSLQLMYQKEGVFHGAAVVGKKVHPRAVRRNRLRRQIYGALYRHQKKFGYSGTYIVVAKPSLEKIASSRVANEVVCVLELVGLGA